jgi:hypothetical protein
MTDDWRDRPAATVVITNHNYGRFLDDAIESALAQEAVAVEVIVVDDGSTDDSDEVLRRRAGSVTIVRQPNLGQAAAINTGFLLARGEVVLFLDADDVLAVDVVSRCCAALDGDPGAVRVQFVLRRFDARGRDLGTTVPADPRRLPRGDCRAAVLSRGDDLPGQPTSGNAFRASALARILPMPVQPYRISADHYLSNLTPLLGRVLVLEGSGGAYRIHGRNADHRIGFDLERTRDIIRRTSVTHAHIAQLAIAEGLIEPGALNIRSVTLPAHRLVVLRLDGPAAASGDGRVRLVFRGLRAAAARRDVTVARRLAMAAWFVAAAVAPRAGVRLLAERGLTSSTQVAPPRWRLRARAERGPA